MAKGHRSQIKRERNEQKDLRPSAKLSYARISVQKAFPNEADELFSEAERMAKLRYQSYVRKSKEDWSETI